MGTYIHLRHSTGDDPQWDFGLSGDRDFARALGTSLPTVTVQAASGDPEDVTYRPADFAVWRAWIAAQTWPNPGRFERMTDLLEADPDLSVYVSW